METFEDDGDAFRMCLRSHQVDGYVVNAQRGSNPDKPILHRATCETITPTPDRKWTTAFIKICSTDRFELDQRSSLRTRRIHTRLIRVAYGTSVRLPYSTLSSSHLGDDRSGCHEFSSGSVTLDDLARRSRPITALDLSRVRECADRRLS